MKRMAMASSVVKQLEDGLFWGIGFTLGFILVIIVLSLLLFPGVKA